MKTFFINIGILRSYFKDYLVRLIELIAINIKRSRAAINDKIHSDFRDSLKLVVEYDTPESN